MHLKILLTTITLTTITLFTACKKDTPDNPQPTDATVPIVISTNPANNATNVPLNKIIEVIFSMPIDSTTVNANTIKLMYDTTQVTYTLNVSGNKLTINPVLLLPDVLYSVTVTTGLKSTTGKTLASNKVWTFKTKGNTEALTPVYLGAAVNYVILAKTAINNSPISSITGDLGISPAAGSYITGLSLVDATGYATSSQVTGKIYAADMAAPTPTNLTTAVDNMLTAYTDAAGRTTPDFLNLGTGNIGGLTLTRGLYKWSTTVTIPTSVTISGGPNDVWIFQIDGDLTVSSAIQVNLVGGALAKNIFWQTAGETTIGATAKFQGIILSMTGITMETGATLNGRALAQTAVILDQNTITQP